jgi:hypothetical protein
MYDLSSIWARTKSYLRKSDGEQPEVMWPEVTAVTWPEVTSVACPLWKYTMRMRNWKLRNIRPSGAFWPEVTKSRDRKRSYPEVALTGSMFCACPAFSRVCFLVVVTWLPVVTEGHLATTSDFSWVCACATGSCATPVVTEGHVTPSEVSIGCSLRRPRLIFSMVTGTNHPHPIFNMVTWTSLG